MSAVEPVAGGRILHGFRARLQMGALIGAASLLVLACGLGIYESVRTAGGPPGISTDYSPGIDRLLRGKDYARAIPELQMALRIDLVNEHIASNNLGNALATQGKWREAIEYYRNALTIRPRYAMAHYNLAKVLASQGDLDGAMAHYSKTLEIDSGHVDAHNNLANLLAALGRSDEAIHHYLEALRLNPDYAEARNNLGWALKNAGRLDEALEHFRSASRRRPELTLPAIGAAWILATHPSAERRNPQEAVRLAEEAARWSGLESPLTLDTLAAAYAAAGVFEKAIPFAEAARGMALRSGRRELAREIRKRLELYKTARPYIETATLTTGDREAGAP